MKPASHPSTPRRAASLVFVAVLTLHGAHAAESDADPAAIAFFEQRIRPVLVDHCYRCHSAGAEKIRGGLTLDTREGLRRGGDSGDALLPGQPEDSLLIRALRHGDEDLAMPPKERLPDTVIADFERWITLGAPDPRDGQAPPPRGIDLEAGRTFWSLRPPQPPPVPEVRTPAWPAGDIDRFLLAAMEARGLAPVADATPRMLLRRVYFDLIGLPPSPEAVARFEADPGPDALAAVVDTLLASPRFGERWGRHWLDVARYAESTGRERNLPYPEAWRYRDYVIDALNADRPYDEFIREQIAGDLLPHADAAERQRHLVATGFLALGPKGLNERNRRQFLADLVDEQIDVTTRAVLGLTVACARCHDHKFDPVPTRDYYALAGILRSSATYYGTGDLGNVNRQPSELLPLDGPLPRPRSPREEELEQRRRRRQALQRLNPANAPAPGTPPTPEQRRRLRQVAMEDARTGTDRATDAGPHAMGVIDGFPADHPLLVRGEIDQPGEPVPRGFLQVIGNLGVGPLPARQSGRRELADWLTRPSNPLTARVAVNRIWQHLFGVGLVRTADNFGATGEVPSHPELLDHLALRFMADGWSVKRMIRTLVLTRAYRLGPSTTPHHLETDPDNRLHWRSAPRRLDAECLRDAMLAAAGTLDTTRPEGSVVTGLGERPVARRPDERVLQPVADRRSVYLPIVRDLVPEALAVFDFPDPSLLTATREVTRAPAQALYLMNDPFVAAQAQALARSVALAPGNAPGHRIDLAYRRVLSRPPTGAERRAAMRFLGAFVNDAGPEAPVGNRADRRVLGAAFTAFCQALFASAEFQYLQ